MSVKDVQKNKKSKQIFDIYSLRHVDKSSQSVSSLSSYIRDLKAQEKQFKQRVEDAQRNIEYYKQKMNKYMRLDDQFSKEQAKYAEGELQLWQLAFVQVSTQLKTVEIRLREIQCTPKKSHKKKKNYVLQKVDGPPSDNQ